MPLFWYSGRTASGARAKDVWISFSETISTFCQQNISYNFSFFQFLRLVTIPVYMYRNMQSVY